MFDPSQDCSERISGQLFIFRNSRLSPGAGAVVQVGFVLVQLFQDLNALHDCHLVDGLFSVSEVS